MELETEELLQKWLKIQIWQYRLAVVFKILIFLSIIISVWGFYVQVLPALKKQLENTQQILENVSSVSETSKQQEDMFNDLLQNIGR